jgi:spore coat protein CotH
MNQLRESAMTKKSLAGPSRRHILAWSVAAVAVAVTGCSSSSTRSTAGKSGTSITGSVTLFDASVPHAVSIVWSEDDYTEMIANYSSESDKSWITADITIDGTLIKNVGVRLKGNSTLMSLGGTGAGGGGMAPGGTTDGTMPTDMANMGGGTRPTDMPNMGGTPPTDMAGGGMGMGTSTDISSDDPATLPLLIRFDKYVDGIQYDGLTQLALRPGSPVINEALALSLTAATDQMTQRYAYTTYSVNGSATKTRLLLENPEETYAESLLDGNGVLFKADADSSFSYQGDDLATYEDQFKQLNKTDDQDGTPIVSFLKWLDAADDATFDAELATWVDVNSFAKYTAMQNLLVNSDDMAGPGQNYYLYYGLSTKKITVVSWDLNLAMSGNATASPDTSLSMGGGGGTGGGKGGKGGKGGNALKTRFLASETFKKLYKSAYQVLYTTVFTDGKGKSLLTTITASIPVSDDLTQDAITEKSATLATFLAQRGEALEKALAS